VEVHRAWAASLAPLDRAAGAGHLEEASAICRRIGAAEPWLGRLRDVFGGQAATPGSRPEAGDTSRFAREGEFWTVTYGGITSRLRDSKGMVCLSRLLASPGRECHILELAALAEGQPVTVDAGDAGPVLDERAKADYRRRLAELGEELAEARANHDPERAARVEAEIDVLTDQLAAAVGLGGRDRRAASAAERARVNVTRVVRAAMVRIGEANPALGRHLDVAVRTGTFCSYLPDPGNAPAWDIAS
jgi:hypothetical protein